MGFIPRYSWFFDAPPGQYLAIYQNHCISVDTKNKIVWDNGVQYALHLKEGVFCALRCDESSDISVRKIESQRK